MGWQNQHSYEFANDDITLGDPGSISDLVPADTERVISLACEPGQVCSYVYDLGDCWTHTITLDQSGRRAGTISRLISTVAALVRPKTAAARPSIAVWSPPLTLLPTPATRKQSNGSEPTSTPRRRAPADQLEASAWRTRENRTRSCSSRTWCP